jgi:PAS domain S-box-containing protein
MTIERRIYVTTGIVTLSILIIGSILLWNSHEVKNGIEQIETSSQVVRSSFLLHSLMDEYLAHGDKRPLRQWHKRNELLGKIINDARGFKSFDRALLKDLEIKYQAVNFLHPQIIDLGTSGDPSEDLKARKETLTGIMAVRLEELVNAAEHLHTASQSLTLKRQKLAETLIMATSILMISLTALSLYQIRKTVVYPLQELSQGAEIIGEGNFEHAVETKGKDEVGKLAHSFNTMVGRLKTIHDSLQAEMEERRRVQGDLQRINEELEMRVHDRTVALTEARDELELRVEERTAELKNSNERLEEEIEERKRAEVALQTASAYNRSLIEASLDPLVTISAEGKITDVNTATERVTGYSRSELIGTDFANYFTDTEKARIGYEQVFCDGSVTNYELAVRHKGGGVTPVMYNASIYRDDSGKVVGIFAAARDITDRKRAEAELTRSNADLQQFAYVASHDLQEPLRNVASCLQLLEKKYKNKLDANADQYIYHAVEASVRMKALILDLLAYSRIGTKGKPPQRIDCEQILDQTVRNLRAAVADAGAVITHEPLPTVPADDTQLLQVFQNLIGNAIKFRRDEPPQIHLSAVKNKNEWIFSVKDNGIGIESRHLDRIFVIFQRLHKRSQYHGTGMGLAIVKKVVERHRGRVWVESEFGSGTTFYFTIPDRGTQT